MYLNPALTWFMAAAAIKCNYEQGVVDGKTFLAVFLHEPYRNSQMPLRQNHK